MQKEYAMNIQKTAPLFIGMIALVLAITSCTNPVASDPNPPAVPRITSFDIQLESGVTTDVDVDDTDQIQLVVNGSLEAIDPATVSFSSNNGATIDTDGSVTFNYYGSETITADITDDDGSVKTASVTVTVNHQHDLLFVGTSYDINTDGTGGPEWNMVMLNTKTNNLLAINAADPGDIRLGSWYTTPTSLVLNLADFSINNDTVGYSYALVDADGDGEDENTWRMVGIDNTDFEYWIWK
jgi:hypothetical protein